MPKSASLINRQRVLPSYEPPLTRSKRKTIESSHVPAGQDSSEKQESLPCDSSLKKTRTSLFQEHVLRGNIDPLIYESGYLRYSGALYRSLFSGERNFDQAIASIGSVPYSREILIYHPQKSPLVDELFERFSETIQRMLHLRGGRVSIFNLFKQLSLFLKNCFAISNTTAACREFVENWEGETICLSKERPLALISLDHFIESKTLVCRHKALLSAIMISKLVKRFPDAFCNLSFSYQRVTTIFGPGHAFLLMRDESQNLYFLDVTSDLCISNETSCNRRWLEQKLGVNFAELELRG